MSTMNIGLIGLAVMGENLVLNMERNGYGVAVYKEILRRRGVIDSVFQRAPGGGLDSHDLQELGEILQGVEPLFRT